MRIKTIFFSVVILMSSLVVAKPSVTDKNKKSPQGEVIRLVVHYGDKISRFEILDEGKTGKLSLQQNQMPEYSKTLTAKEVSYLKERIDKMPAITNDTSLCPRRYIHLSAKKHDKLGCIGGQNAVAKELLDLANLLSTQF